MAGLKSEEARVTVSDVKVFTTTDRGHNPEEYAEMALAKIIHVSDTATPEVKAQARAFKDKLRIVLIHYLTEAAKADRRTVVAALQKIGHGDLAKHIIAL